MPSASSKVDKQTFSEGAEPLKLALKVVEHKIRNLEKRKARLDSYRQDYQKGKELNDDQKAAIAKYDEVEQTLEFARDLSKQFVSIINETKKTEKRQQKRELQEKALEDQKKVQDILVIQEVLNNMGTEDIREDFLANKRGTVKITEDDLANLDELYKLINVTRDEAVESQSYEESLSHAAEHLVCLSEGRAKDFLKTTYQELRDLIFNIHRCDYFVKQNTAEEENGLEEDYEDAQETLPTQREEAKSPTTSSHIPTPDLTPVPETPVVPLVAPSQPEPAIYHQKQPQTVSELMESGNINFLQDSEIVPEASHIDPAIVSAQPMKPDSSLAAGGGPIQFVSAPPTAQVPAPQPEYPIPSQTFTNQNFATNSQVPVPFNTVPQAFQTAPLVDTTPNPPPPIPMPQRVPQESGNYFQAASDYPPGATPAPMTQQSEPHSQNNVESSASRPSGWSECRTASAEAPVDKPAVDSNHWEPERQASSTQWADSDIGEWDNGDSNSSQWDGGNQWRSAGHENGDDSRRNNRGRGGPRGGRGRGGGYQNGRGGYQGGGFRRGGPPRGGRGGPRTGPNRGNPRGGSRGSYNSNRGQ